MKQLQALTNNEKREQFLNTYQSWELWVEVPEVKEKYFRYPLPNHTDMIAKQTTHCYAQDYWKESSRGKEYTSVEYYLLEEGRYFADCKISKSQLIEYLRKNKSEF